MAYRMNDRELAQHRAYEWNRDVTVGQRISYTVDHGRTWPVSTVASRAFLRDNKAVVRVRGEGAPLPLENVVPETR
jgi:hypothetical protein